MQSSHTIHLTVQKLQNDIYLSIYLASQCTVSTLFLTKFMSRLLFVFFASEAVDTEKMLATVELQNQRSVIYKMFSCCCQEQNT